MMFPPPTKDRAEIPKDVGMAFIGIGQASMHGLRQGDLHADRLKRMIPEWFNSAIAVHVASLALILLLATGIAAQSDLVWIEVEVLDNLSRAEDLANEHSSSEMNLQVYPTITGKYALAYGPFEQDRASEVMVNLLSDPGQVWSSIRLVPAGEYYVPDLPDSTAGLPGEEAGEVEVVIEDVLDPILVEGIEEQSLTVELPDYILPSGNEQAVTDGFIEGLADQLPLLADEVESLELPELDYRVTDIENLVDFVPQTTEVTGDHLMQVALRLLGYYPGAIDGIIGSRSIAGTRRFLAERGLPVSDSLDEAQLDMLLSEFEAEHGFFGTRWLDSEELGIRVLIPAALTEFDRIEPPYILYRPADDRNISLLLISALGDREALRSIHASLLDYAGSTPSTNPVTEDGFTIIASDDDQNFLARVILRDDTRIRGFVVSWPTHQSSWFGGYASMMGTSLREASDYGFIIQSEEDLEEAGTTRKSQVVTRAPARLGSGFFLDSQGHVYTSYGNVVGCEMITVDNLHEFRILDSMAEHDMALLEPESEIVPFDYARFESEALPDDGEAFTAGYPFHGSLVPPVVTRRPIKLLSEGVDQPPVWVVDGSVSSGELGGPVANRSGNVVGMIGKSTVTDTSLPNGHAQIRSPEILREMLASHGLGLETANYSWDLELHALTRQMQDYTVPVHCYKPESGDAGEAAGQ